LFLSAIGVAASFGFRGPMFPSDWKRRAPMD
jgi:hypothetical protein